MATGGSLKGVALIAGGDSNSAVRGSLHFIHDAATGHTQFLGARSVDSPLVFMDSTSTPLGTPPMVAIPLVVMNLAKALGMQVLKLDVVIAPSPFIS